MKEEILEKDPLTICKEKYKVGMTIKSIRDREITLTQEDIDGMRYGRYECTKHFVFIKDGSYGLYNGDFNEFAIEVKENKEMKEFKFKEGDKVSYRDKVFTVVGGCRDYDGLTYVIHTHDDDFHGHNGTHENLEWGSPIPNSEGHWFVDADDIKLIEKYKEIKLKTTMQKLSRQGLKEIHSVACSKWRGMLETYSKRNTLEDYIELTQNEVDEMFNACTANQLPIVSKYLKQDDGSVDLSDLFEELNYNRFIQVRNRGDLKNKSFYLELGYNWEIKTDNRGIQCLVPTKKKY